MGKKRSYLEIINEIERKLTKNSEERLELESKIMNLKQDKIMDQALLKSQGKYHIKDDLKLQRKYQQLSQHATQLLPKIIREGNPKLTMKLVDATRRYLPKAFFNSIAKVTSTVKRG